MSEKLSFAEVEFLILEKTSPKSSILPVKEEVFKLLKKFNESGQSGGSAPYTAWAISMDIKKGIKNNLLIELNKNPDSLSYEFTKEINELCDKIKNLGLEKKIDFITEKIEKLFLFDPISPIMGIDEEWGDVRNIGDGKPWYQNKRCSALFKDGKDGKPYYIDAIIKKDQKGNCWSGFAWLNEEDYRSGDRDKMIGKKGYVKSFPFLPKTFYIDVKDVEVAKDDWESFVIDPSQLDAVWDYYDPK